MAKAKNVCQVCLLDLDYNLPVQVRDQALGMQDEGLPESAAGKEYALKRMADEGELDRSRFNAPAASDLLQKLARPAPYYKRNEARVCSFFARGECKRGAECPYRHEMPTSGPLSQQNIKDRYYGVNDPVANKMMARAAGMGTLTPPDDATIMTLFVGGVGPAVSEDDLRDVFYPYGELKSVRKLETRACAFVTYTTRAAAEKAAEALTSRVTVKGEQCKLLWGKPQAPRGQGGGAGPSGANADPAGGGGGGFFNLPAAGQAAGLYPSMDPMQAGTRTAPPEKRQQQQQQAEGGSKRPRPDGPGPPPAP